VGRGGEWKGVGVRGGEIERESGAGGRVGGARGRVDVGGRNGGRDGGWEGPAGGHGARKASRCNERLSHS